MNMQVTHTDNTLSFPRGLIGFEDQSLFKLFHQQSENPTVHLLQSMTDEGIFMSIVSPEALDLEYSITLSDEEQTLLQLDHAEDAIVALIVYKPIKDGQPLDMKAIAKAPIIINTKAKVALQKPLGKEDTIN